MSLSAVQGSVRLQHFVVFEVPLERCLGQAKLPAVVAHGNSCCTALQYVGPSVVIDQVVRALAGYEVRLTVFGVDPVQTPPRFQDVEARAASDNNVAALAVPPVEPAAAHPIAQASFSAPVHKASPPSPYIRAGLP